MREKFGCETISGDGDDDVQTAFGGMGRHPDDPLIDSSGADSTARKVGAEQATGLRKESNIAAGTEAVEGGGDS